MFSSHPSPQASCGPNPPIPPHRSSIRAFSLVIFGAGMLVGIFALSAWQGVSPGSTSTAEAQSKKKPRWNFTQAGTVPTEFGELITVNGTSGNYTMVFQDTDKNVRLVDLRGGKVPSRAIVIDRQ
ncbi:MAG: hypothetical protein HN891_03200 [Planctomycetes bacterium]|jgi:hypothetical protein|nr:hypothetical protein [Planctomycetota bacterium]MBT6452884.1 hypothetical protein [Planctomycetota bacterium]MBT6783699.1 hypothetical protein [Planctomycetota bacterium]MBT6967501.1 hypothetical protein [Planctomycetota bacterium]MBT7103085.1 hypothetical protein [Planctomycetota bacterium]